MASLSQFTSTIASSDVARQNRFEAQIMSPIGGLDYASGEPVEISITVRPDECILRY